MNTHKQAKSGEGRNRRQFARIPAESLPQLTARVVGGPQVRLLDVSRRGAQFETTFPLRPGRPVTIRFVAVDTSFTLTGAVVRSSVAVLAEDGVKYHTALSFTEDVVACPETLAGEGMARADDAPRDAAAETTASPQDDLMVVNAPEETGAALRDRLLANSW